MSPDTPQPILEGRNNQWDGQMGLRSVVVNDVADVPAGVTLYAIHVKLDGCGQALRVTRTKIMRKCGHKKDHRVFVKSTFPLLLVRQACSHKGSTTPLGLQLGVEMYSHMNCPYAELQFSGPLLPISSDVCPIPVCFLCVAYSDASVTDLPPPSRPHTGTCCSPLPRPTP